MAEGKRFKRTFKNVEFKYYWRRICNEYSLKCPCCRTGASASPGPVLQRAEDPGPGHLQLPPLPGGAAALQEPAEGAGDLGRLPPLPHLPLPQPEHDPEGREQFYNSDTTQGIRANKVIFSS